MLSLYVRAAKVWSGVHVHSHSENPPFNMVSSCEQQICVRRFLSTHCAQAKQTQGGCECERVHHGFVFLVTRGCRIALTDRIHFPCVPLARGSRNCSTPLHANSSRDYSAFRSHHSQAKCESMHRNLLQLEESKSNTCECI